MTGLPPPSFYYHHVGRICELDTAIHETSCRLKLLAKFKRANAKDAPTGVLWDRDYLQRELSRLTELRRCAIEEFKEKEETFDR